ncbi:MAG: D-aminoacyl-tRNA deacylase [Halobacteriales archaeon]|nr:D-aminoacyl-tRNA deacylase [Halobacteriales archaeon]
MIGVVVSREDVASLTIRDALLRAVEWDEREPRGDWKREWTHGDAAGDDDITDGFVMVEKDGLHLHYDGVDADLRAEFDVSLVVFVSRHSGDTGPLLTAHHTGNFGEAEYGGEDASLAVPAPDAARHLLRRFAENAPEDFDVGVEATHHGPSELETPSLFAEVGSGPDEWEREDAARAVAEGVLSLSEREEPRTTVVGVGGGHYAPRFTRVVLETDAAVGHVAADYALDDLNETLLHEAYETSGADALLLDGEATDAPPECIEDYPVVTEPYLRERAGVPETTAEAVEDTLGEAAGDAHLTERAEPGADAVVEFTAGLVQEARNVDAEATDAALERHALGYVEEGGHVESVAVAPDERRALADALAEVLSAKYDVHMTDDSVVLEREVFDAEKARELGVEEGPAFGRLSAGETVEVEGRTVSPDDVHTGETREFELRQTPQK